MVLAGAIAIAALSAGLAGVIPGAATDTAFAKRGTCSLTPEEGGALGHGGLAGRRAYVLSLKTRRVPCGKAKGVVKAFHKCRRANGGVNGRCNQRVKTFRCKEGKRQFDPNRTRWDARVVCRRGTKRVIHPYSQFR